MRHINKTNFEELSFAHYIGLSIMFMFYSILIYYIV